MFVELDNKQVTILDSVREFGRCFFKIKPKKHHTTVKPRSGIVYFSGIFLFILFQRQTTAGQSLKCQLPAPVATT